MPEPKKQQEKRWYVVKIEGTAPITLELRVLAENEDEAFNIVEKKPHNAQLLNVSKPNINRLVKKKVVIRDWITGLSKWMKNF